MKIYIHIGLPKAYSTSIQHFLSLNEGSTYRYIGFRPEKNINNWYDDKEISTILNKDLRFTNNSNFKSRVKIIKEYFRKIISECKSENKDLWISSETLSTKFILQDIDSAEKILRLQEIFDEKLNFVIVFRDLFDLSKSIYKEYVKNGYSFSFSSFCDETYYFRESNFLYDIIPEFNLENLKNNIRKKDNILFIN